MDGAASTEEKAFAEHLVKAYKPALSEDVTFFFEQMETDRAMSGNTAVRFFLTTVAGHVLDLAADNDPYASTLVERACLHLSALVKTAGSCIGDENGRVPLCVSGSLIASFPKFREQLHNFLCDKFGYLAPQEEKPFPYSPLIGIGLKALNCSEPSDISGIGSRFLSDFTKKL